MNGRFRAVAIPALLALLPVSGLQSQQRRDVAGRVLTVQDSTPINGVSVRIGALDIATTTGESGGFVLPGIPRTLLSVTFQRIGLAPDTTWLEPDQDTMLVYLQSAAVLLPAVEAQAQLRARERFDEIVQPSLVSIDRNTIRTLPALAEADVVKVVQLLPGTIATNDYSVGFNVRGGEPDQNLIQMDGVTIFNPTHLGGLFSTFDANAVENVNFITGAFPAEYGGRLSSVMDVDIRAGRSDRIGVRGLVSLISSKLLVEGPIGGTGISFLVAGRRTYADVLVGLLTSETMPYYFYDAIGKLAAPVGSGGVLSLTGYLGKDVVDWPWIEERPGRSGVTLDASFGNRLVGLRFSHPLGRGDITVDASYTNSAPTFGLEPGIFRADNRVRLMATKFLFAVSPGATHDVRLGAGYESYEMTYDAGSESLSAEFYKAAFFPRVWSAFIDDQWRAFPWLFLRPGIRVEAVEGPGVVNWAPRIGIKGFVSKDFAITGSVGRYYQAIHSLRDQNIPWNMIDFWIGADAAIPVGRSDHVVLGFERWFGLEMSLSIEGYYKTFDDIVDYNLDEDPRVQGDETIPMEGEAWGVDFLLRKHLGRFTGWIAYGLTKVNRRSRGQEFPAVHDRRHMLNVILQSPGPLGSDMSVRLGYGSPLPFTPFVGEWNHRYYYAADHSLSDYDREPIASQTLNSARYPYYGRIDISFWWETRKWGGILRPYVQLVNMLNRKNVFLYTYDYTTAPATRSAISQLPLLPTVGVEFVF
ncbi:MAG: hypothetical protein AMS18_09320 [Gemmatimonas sp. SG8_17]|nr:MAG: hypothetical protein AMS18_09320 [Gemmatimonas sp. SG8_17]